MLKETITLEQRISIIQDIAVMKKIMGEEPIDAHEFDVLMEISSSSLVGIASLMMLFCEAKINKRL